MVLANAWSINRNEEFERPNEFMPERFLDNKYGIKPNIAAELGEQSNRREQYAFGAGRRVCAGIRMAERTNIVIMAKLLWSFDLAGKIDSSVETGYTGGFLIAPYMKGKLHLTPRGKDRVAIIEREYDTAEGYLQQFDD